MEWIKINDDGTSDRIPKDLDNILLYDNQHHTVEHGYLWRTNDGYHYNKNGKLFSWMFVDRNLSNCDPTHWMDFPDPPEVE
ncbi:hypothetical protein LCGC14_1478540 [marine sediment metagenome]|uniref:DUF551 domain-containing protein n=1 Tax=marine sediment metagenome TaxID=412755 RepID=A0A0F9MBX1_9ZZZZ